MRHARGWGLTGEAPPSDVGTTTEKCVPAWRIGQVARRLIAQDRSGQVLARVTGAIYLVLDNGEMCWLASRGVPMHARGISAPCNQSRVRQGTRFEVRAGRLHLEKDLSVDCAAAAIWRPPVIDPGRIARPEEVLARVNQLQEHIEGNGLPDRANSIVHDVESACLDRDLARAVWSCQALIGMGPGLTPSGDDFIGGLLFTLSRLHPVYPDLMKWDRQLAERLCKYARTRTNIISYHLLRDYANGLGAEPLHRLLADLLSAETNGHLADSARQVVGIGNTSGRELLAGALTALRFLDRRGDLHDNRYQTAN